MKIMSNLRKKRMTVRWRDMEKGVEKIRRRWRIFSQTWLAVR